jgi:hypothetical protein
VARSRKELEILLTAVRLPACFDSEEAGFLLGFLDHEVTILMGAGLLKPLGKPARNGRKFFGRDYILELGQDRGWLENATRAVANYWKKKRKKEAVEASKDAK